MKNKFDYKLSFRLLNFVIPSKFIFDDNLCLTNLSQGELHTKYPLNKNLSRVTNDFLPHWKNHTTEIEFSIKGNNLKEISSVENEHYYENIVQKTFMLSNLDKPTFTHSLIFCNNPHKNALVIRVISGFRYKPIELTENNLEELKSSYLLIKEIEKDSILSASLNQLMNARNKGNHDINKVNSPNWDKIVNYVTALEILLLNGLNGELTYRFKLNGSTLLSIIESGKKRELFDSLGELYALRSIIVHGGNTKKILPKVSKIIKNLKIIETHHEHPIGQLFLLCDQLDSWIYSIFKYAITLEVSERPFSDSKLWEDWLWK